MASGALAPTVAAASRAARRATGAGPAAEAAEATVAADRLPARVARGARRRVVSGGAGTAARPVRAAELGTAVGVEGRVGEVDALRSHALRELQEVLARLGLLLGRLPELAGEVGALRPARLLRFSERRVVAQVGERLAVLPVELRPAVTVELRVGEVDAVVPHALRVGQQLDAQRRGRLLR